MDEFQAGDAADDARQQEELGDRGFSTTPCCSSQPAYASDTARTPQPPARSANAVGLVLTTLQPEFFPHADRPRPSPDLRHLRVPGIPTVDDKIYAQAVQRRAARRTAVQGYLRSDGWIRPSS